MGRTPFFLLDVTSVISVFVIQFCPLTIFYRNSCRIVTGQTIFSLYGRRTMAVFIINFKPLSIMFYSTNHIISPYKIPAGCKTPCRAGFSTMFFAYAKVH